MFCNELGWGKILVLGSGGAHSEASPSDAGAQRVVMLWNGLDNCGDIARHSDVEMIVNAAPAGMYSNNCGSGASAAKESWI